jgi:D-lactate dehydrogenase
MLDELRKILPNDRLKTRYIDLVSYASDAGFYHLVPKAVVQPVDEAEVKALFRLSHAHRVPLVFRTGGTSLSGQSVTDGILVDLSRHWDRLSLEASGGLVRVQPGITGAMVNQRLRSHHRKIGPDPSSISAAMMGGILSNNASGMCCGVAQNSYHTLRHLRFLLPDGNAYTTEDASDYGRFEREQAALCDELSAIREQVHADTELYARIRAKFRTKTTIGYSLNAFIDHRHPLDILAHLLIGAEGTLAFLSEAVLETVPEHPYKSTALLYFPDIHSACRAIPAIVASGAAMAELMDRASLRSVQDLPGMPPVVRSLPESAAAILLEFQEPGREALAQRVGGFLADAASLPLLHLPAFTEDPTEQAFLWKVRKGLFPAVGAVRAAGTSVILEDLAFPLEGLADAVTGLQELFLKYGYDNGIIFGHAKDGNIHFVVTQTFNTPAEVDRYDRFLREVVTLVVERHGGTLKAEHGTGRNMAPFVETEWGGEAYAIIRRIKRAVDPMGLLNPGVIVNDDPQAHLRDLKRMPQVEEEVDRCIECGYCEHRCPSRDLTATPRRRIVLRRALKNLEDAGDREGMRRLMADFDHEVLDTCAVDGLCASACPVDINTGDLVKRLRRESHSPRANRLALWTVRRFAWMESAVRLALHLGVGLGRVFGRDAMPHLTRLLRRALPGFPLWSRQLQAPPSLRPMRAAAANPSPDADAIVYFPACITRVMGTAEGYEDLPSVFLRICRTVGIGVVVPEGLTGSCCSQIYSSKGFTEAWKAMAARTLDGLWVASREGRLDVVTDVSSCALTLRSLRPALDAGRRTRYDAMRFLDSVEFLHDRVMPRVPPLKVRPEVVLHPVCSLERMGAVGKLRAVASHFSERATIPAEAGCCGMAGDRGFTYPELTASATRKEALEVSSMVGGACYSSTRTCEMALSEATGRDYVSILYLVDEALRYGISTDT